MTAPRVPQMKTLGSLDAFVRRSDALGIAWPGGADGLVDDPQQWAAVLSAPVVVRDGTAGERTIPNRFVALPMEGWDGTEAGEPTDLVRRRWQRLGESGCGLVWGEAAAVVPEGRANPHQLVVAPSTVDGLAALRALLDPAQVAGLQLTHSGRWCRPGRARTAYRHPVLDARLGDERAQQDALLSDDELDELVERYVDAAVHARDAGFDFVDVKHCHGYLLHELLSAYDRPGRYGGDLAGRTRFVRSVVNGIRAAAPGLAIAVRCSVFDFVPFAPGPDGTGRPAAATGTYRYAFGGDGSGTGIDLEEASALLGVLEELGVGLVSTTAGSPYYTPHIQRPAFFPPSDGYRPPEDPLVGVARQVEATGSLAARHPGLALVGSGYTYLQEWLPAVAAAAVASGATAMVGLGRMLLSYPTLAADVLAGRPLVRRALCRTFSDCTTAPRHGMVSGCYPLDPFYKGRPERVELARVKQEARRREP